MTGRFTSPAPGELTEVERASHAVTRRILAAGTLDDDAYAQAVSVLGTGRLFELCTLIGWYTMIAIQLSVFGLVPPEKPAEPGGAGGGK
jgi:hypothetical protein